MLQSSLCTTYIFYSAQFESWLEIFAALAGEVHGLVYCDPRCMQNCACKLYLAKNTRRCVSCSRALVLSQNWKKWPGWRHQRGSLGRGGYGDAMEAKISRQLNVIDFGFTTWFQHLNKNSCRHNNNWNDEILHLSIVRSTKHSTTLTDSHAPSTCIDNIVLRTKRSLWICLTPPTFLLP